MNRKLMTMLALALMLTCGKPAWAGFDSVTAANCGFSSGNILQHVVYPYFAKSTGNYWSGFAINNLLHVDIAANALCLAVYNDIGAVNIITGQQIAATTLMTAAGIPANGMFATTMEALRAALEAATPGSNFAFLTDRNLALSVYTDSATNNVTLKDGDDFIPALKGFGMMGTENHAQGYLALNNAQNENPVAVYRNNTAGAPGNVLKGGADLYFDYVPGGLWTSRQWASGFAIFNNHNAATTVRISGRLEDGTVLAQVQKIIAANTIETFLLEDIYNLPTPPKRARIQVESTSGERIHGFAYFTNTRAAQGMIPVYGKSAGGGTDYTNHRYSWTQR